VGAIEGASPWQGSPPASVGGASEAALVERAKHGDQEAFARLVDERLPSTFRTVMAILGNESDARDVTQAIFLRVWTNLPGLRESDRFPAWFGRIVVNTSRTSIRGRRRRIIREIPVSTLPEGDASFAGIEVGHEERFEHLDLLERALDRIAPSERTILWLHHYEQLSLAEIGVRLGVPAKRVKSRLFTARRSLERALQAEDR